MILKREPVLVMGLIQAMLGLLVSFGLQLSASQVGAILVASAALLSFLTRRQVAPSSTSSAAPAVQVASTS